MATEESLPLSTSDLRQPVRIRMSKDGLGSTAPKTVMQVLDGTAKAYPNKPALHQKIIKKGQIAANVEFTTWTWKEYRAKVDEFGKALLSLGFEPFDIINIIGFNSREWFTANFGAIAAGGVAAGIYATNLPDACKYISEHSEAKVVVLEGIKQLEKYYDISKELPHLKALVTYGSDELTEEIKAKCAVPVYTFDEFLALGKEVPDADIKARTDALKPNQTCTLIYTSGTTGPPKAVMITHDNLTWTVQPVLKNLPGGTLTPEDKMISYLPLSHIAAQMLDMHAAIGTGMQVFFAQPDALKGTLGATLKEVRPTVFFGVPRVWEKIYEKLQEVGRSTTGIKKKLSTWAKAKAMKHWEGREYGSKTSSPAMFFLAKKLLHKAHVALGLDQAKMLFVAAAPIELKVLKYFSSLDLPIFEIFGQSECTGPHTMSTFEAVKFGTVGRPLLGTKSRVDAENGELCYTGRHIFAGYMKMPEKTKETIDPEGWLHSGDVVKFDSNDDPNIEKPSGFMTITGRIKELIITAGGENIPPVLIEEQVKLSMPALSNCMVIGDKRKFLSILLCLQVEIDADGNATNKLAAGALEVGRKIGSSATTTEEAQADEAWTKYFDEGVARANKAATSRAQKVSKWALLNTDFTEPGGELTPTLKLKRSVAQEKYKDAIEGIYEAIYA